MSELINVWREIGAYNRFADTKLALLFGLVVGLLGAAHSGVSIGGPAFVLLGGSRAIFDIFLSVSAVVIAIGLVPRLTVLSIPYSLFSHSSASQRLNANPYYFMDVALFASAEEWLECLDLDLDQPTRRRALMLAQQVIAISHIARLKYRSIQVSLAFFLFGIGLSWIIKAVDQQVN